MISPPFWTTNFSLVVAMTVIALGAKDFAETFLYPFANQHHECPFLQRLEVFMEPLTFSWSLKADWEGLFKEHQALVSFVSLDLFSLGSFTKRKVSCYFSFPRVDPLPFIGAESVRKLELDNEMSVREKYGIICPRNHWNLATPGYKVTRNDVMEYSRKNYKYHLVGSLISWSKL